MKVIFVLNRAIVARDNNYAQSKYVYSNDARW